MLDRQTRRQMQAQSFGIYVRLWGYAGQGKTRVDFAARAGVHPDVVGEIIDKPPIVDSEWGEVSMYDRRTLEQVVRAVEVDPAKRRVLKELLAGITPQGYTKLDGVRDGRMSVDVTQEERNALLSSFVQQPLSQAV
ncbi:MAG: hypothetical protein UU27_C0012G0012 [Parcubacteria group bacterium GW2011_GWD1_40_9]|nr:MAG: hypothetical protein UU27_C0012G0012 [Parcubacteria group bacterium GW2011_GWD1_40_9]